jgi:uncharacterized protein (TIGR02231 family)
MKYKISIFLMLLAMRQAWAGNVKTAPDEVTVYPAGATVLRVGKADLPAGAQKVLFEGLPAGLREESLRLKAQGPKGTIVYGLKLREAFSDQDQVKRRMDLEAKIQDLEDRKADLSDRIASHKSEADILKSLAEKAASKAESGARVSELALSVGSVGKRLESLAAASRVDERGQRTMDKKLVALKAELGLDGPGQTTTRVVEAEIELAEAGACRFELVYFVDQASWTPRYDLRLKASEKEPKVELDFLAELRQFSGEDWSDVSLKLSTARPTLDSQVPDPTQWWLDYQTNQPVYRSAMSNASGFARPQAQAMEMSKKKTELFEEAQAPTATVQDLGPAMLFGVKRRVSLPSMNQGQRVAIARSEHAAELLLVAVPRLASAAYLEANIQYSAEQPLLPGPAQLFLDGDLSGQVQLPSTGPGEKFKLGFGMDERIKVSRKRRAQKDGQGFFSAKNKRNYDWDIKVANYHEGPRDIEVREQLPRSRQSDIKVSSSELDPKPLAEDPEKPGLLRWSLKLKKGEEKNLRLRYEVTWPENQRVGGLE